jgi:hypothetical protein
MSKESLFFNFFLSGFNLPHPLPVGRLAILSKDNLGCIIWIFFQGLGDYAAR